MLKNLRLVVDKINFVNNGIEMFENAEHKSFVNDEEEQDSN